MQQLNDLVSPLVLNGQPLSHIFAVHADEIPVCRRTLYNYFDQRVFQARNIDLPRRVRYKKRKKRSEPRVKNIEQVYRNKRTYKDFEFFMEHHPDLDVVEMDTVKGGQASGKCLLTLLFRSCSFMLVILLPRCTQECVVNAINELYSTLGPRLFKKYFPVILTDNGSEFKNPWDIEKTEDGKRAPMYSIAILMCLTRRPDLRRTMNTFAMSFQKVEACTSTLRKTSTLWQVTSIQQPETA